MSKLPHARISLTLPPEVLAEADRLADELDRSRSWVISEAIRRYAKGRNLSGDPAPIPSLGMPGKTDRLVDEGRSPLGDQRLAQLRVEMAMTAEERVRSSEEAADGDRLPGPDRHDRLLAFTRFEDYLAWDLEARR